jgi:hypothetical protein
MEYDNTNTFILSPNQSKAEEKDRDWNGTVNINGVEYWLNGWNRKGNRIGGSVKLKEGKQTRSLREVVRELNPEKFDKPVTEEDLPDWLK